MRPNVARGFDGVIENYTGLSFVPLTRTCGWSDGPHVTTRAYYIDFVIPSNLADVGSGARKFMEESLHYRMQRNGSPGGCWELKKKAARGERPLRWPTDFDQYGTYLYGVASERDGSYMLHRSLRGNVPQWGLHDAMYPSKSSVPRLPLNGGQTGRNRPGRPT